jgi:mRNA interferase RelE/StbE
MLSSISDRRVRDKIVAVIDRLAVEPEKQGKALVGELSGLRSIRAVGQRYRVVYQLVEQQVVVTVLAVGIRRDGSRDDIYQLAKKLIKLRLLQ